MKPGLKGALLLLLAFSLGAATGALGFGVYQARTGGWPPRAEGERFQRYVLRRLARELDLRADQRNQIEMILRESGQDFARLREEIRPRFHEIRRRIREQIGGVLDPGQREKFEVLVEKWDRRLDRRYRRDQPSGDGESKSP